MAAPKRYYSSVAVATALSNGITQSATAFAVDQVAGWPASTPYTLRIDAGTASEELVTVTQISGTSVVQCVRGVDGTSASTHSQGAVVEHVVSARDYSEPQQHMADSSGVHGLAAGSAVVGTTDTQTLTHKTIQQSVIDGGTAQNVQLVTPTMGDFTGAQHDHGSAGKGGPVVMSAVTGLAAALAARASLAGDTFTGDVTLPNLHVGSKIDTGSDVTIGGKLTVSGTQAALPANLLLGGTAIGAMQSFAPTVTASSTNPTLGTGATFTGRYSQIGKLVFVAIKMQLGTSPNAGSGEYAFSLPVAADTTSTFQPILHAFCSLPGAPSVNIMLGMGRSDATATTFKVYWPSSTANDYNIWTDTSPGAAVPPWTAGTMVIFSGWYWAA